MKKNSNFMKLSRFKYYLPQAKKLDECGLNYSFGRGVLDMGHNMSHVKGPSYQLTARNAGLTSWAFFCLFQLCLNQRPESLEAAIFQQPSIDKDRGGSPHTRLPTFREEGLRVRNRKRCF